MKRVKLNRLNEIVLIDADGFDFCEGGSFIGYTTKIEKDINNNNSFEIMDSEQKYYYVAHALGSSIFISEKRLLDILLSDYIKQIENQDVYSHGYPTNIPLPRNFYEDCRTSFCDHVIDEVTDKITAIIKHSFEIN